MPTLIELLEAGAHFGHKKARSHPKAKDYTFTLREGIYVIDLDKTILGLEMALDFIKKQTVLGKTILFVGTKRQAKDLVQSVAEKSGMPYINQRWLGGTLTNFETIRKNLKNLEDLEAKSKDEKFSILTKKEQKVINDKIEKLNKTFGGVRTMKNLPDAVFVVDAAKEKLAVTEANIKEIPIVAIADTDADFSQLTYPIPANDDAPKTLEMIMGLVAEALSVPTVKKEPARSAANLKAQSDAGGEVKEEPKEIAEEIKTEIEKPKKTVKKVVAKAKIKKPARHASGEAVADGEK